MTELSPDYVVVGRIEIFAPSKHIACYFELTWYVIRPKDGHLGCVF